MITGSKNVVMEHLAEIKKKKPNCYLGIVTEEDDNKFLYIGPQSIVGEDIVLDGYIKFDLFDFGQAREVERREP